jgi:hypothetical protein
LSRGFLRFGRLSTRIARAAAIEKSVPGSPSSQRVGSAYAVRTVDAETRPGLTGRMANSRIFPDTPVTFSQPVLVPSANFSFLDEEQMFPRKRGDVK